MSPFSQNIIFFDTEFTTLDPNKGELISIGLVKYTGEELYIELEFNEETVEAWVRDHVLPTLTGEKLSREAACEKLWDFMGRNITEHEKPILLAYVNQFDAIYWYKLFGNPKNHPAFWIPIDFASILFAHGYKPDSMGDQAFLKTFGVNQDDKKLHNALYDAQMLRTVYTAFMKQHTRDEE